MLKSQQLGGGIPLRKPFSPERGFNYAAPIRIISHYDGILDDYSIRLELNENNFDFSQVRSDGADIRFKDSKRRHLDYYIHSWNKTTKTASISVRLGELEAYEETYIWLISGKENAISQSTLDGAYFFYDDFNYPWTSTDLNTGDHADWDVKWGTHKWTSGTSAITDAWGERLYTTATEVPYSYEGWETTRTFPYPFVVEFQLRRKIMPSQDRRGQFYIFLDSLNSICLMREDWIQAGYNFHGWRLYEKDNTIHSYADNTDGPWDMKIIFDNSNFELFRDNILIIDATNDVEIPYLKSVNIKAYHRLYGVYHPLDNFKVTKYCPNPPTYEFL